MRKALMVFGSMLTAIGCMGITTALGALAQVRQWEYIEHRDQAFTPAGEIWHTTWVGVSIASGIAVGIGAIILIYGLRKSAAAMTT